MFDKPKKLRCKICKGMFEMKTENRYIVAEPTREGFAALSSGAGIVYFDAFDCPFCGCQNITGVRKPKLANVKEEEK